MFVPFCTHPANQSVDSSFLILASQHTSCSGCWWILHTTCPRHWDQRPVRCSVFLAISPCQLHCLHQRCTENQEGSSVGLFTSIFLAGSSVDCWLFFCDAVIKPKHSHFHTCVCSNEARISSILSCKGLLALAVGFAKLLPLGVAHSSPGNILRSQINPFFSNPHNGPLNLRSQMPFFSSPGNKSIENRCEINFHLAIAQLLMNSTSRWGNGPHGVSPSDKFQGLLRRLHQKRAT